MNYYVVVDEGGWIGPALIHNPKRTFFGNLADSVKTCLNFPDALSFTSKDALKKRDEMKALGNESEVHTEDELRKEYPKFFVEETKAEDNRVKKSPYQKGSHW